MNIHFVPVVRGEITRSTLESRFTGVLHVSGGVCLGGSFATIVL
jgi:hypothetical protein